MIGPRILGFKCGFCEREVELADNPTTGLMDTWRDVATGDPNCFDNQIGDLPIRVRDFYAVQVSGLHSPFPIYEDETL
jgi:hypothetical protein